MGIHLPHSIRILKIKSKKKIFASRLSSVKFTFFFNVLLRQVGVAPSWPCHALVLLAPNSWDHELSADVLFVFVLATVLSEYWKKLEEIFFWNDITLRRLWKLYHFEKKISSLFQYSDRTIASTETNDTSTESSDAKQMESLRVWHYQEGSTPLNTYYRLSMSFHHQ